MEKTCFKCHKLLPLKEYYRHHGMKDGHLGKCKECAKNDVKKTSKKNIRYCLICKNKFRTNDGKYCSLNCFYKSKTGKKLSEETKRKIARALTGKKKSKEAIEKMRKALTGRKNPEQSKRMTGRKSSIETRLKQSLAHRGDKAPNWKGGITLIHDKIRNSIEYRLWRESVFKRDNWTCIWCGAKNGNGHTVILHADHIKPFAYFPELRFVVDNGRTLCEPCHKSTETYGSRISNKLTNNYCNKKQ